MKEFALVISLWGHTGLEWEFIANQSILKESLSQEHCEFSSHEELQDQENKKYYEVLIHCYPVADK